MKTVCKLFLYLTICFALSAQGQNTTIDSLKLLLQTQRDSAKIDLYISLSEAYYNSGEDSTRYFAQAAIQESKEIGYVRGEADGFKYLGLTKLQEAKLASGLEDLFSALELYRELKDSSQIGSAYNNIGIGYAISRDYKKSIDFFSKTVEIYREIGQYEKASGALNNIGLAYKKLGNNNLAKEYLVKALTIKELNGDTEIASSYHNLAKVLRGYELFDEALRYHRKADSAYLAIEDERGRLFGKSSMAETYLRQNQIGLALKKAGGAYDIAKEKDYKLVLQEVLRVIVLIKAEIKNYEEAYIFQKEYQEVTDSLSFFMQFNALEELKSEFELKEKNRQIELLEKQQQVDQAKNERQQFANYLLIISIGFMLLALALLGWAHVHNRKKNIALIQANKEKDRFISILSHDVRGPLNSLKGFASLLKEDPNNFTLKELEFFGSKLNDSIDNLLKLVNGILDWFFSKKSINTLSPENLDVTEIIHEVIQLYELPAYQKNVKLINNSERGAICVFDKNALLTILRNLVSNALKFSKNGDSITLGTDRLNMKRISISVADTGMGIAKKDLSQLFKYSKKKVKKGTNSEMGSGLGLALSKELVENSGGFLNVESEESVGSKFSIILPSVD